MGDFILTQRLCLLLSLMLASLGCKSIESYPVLDPPDIKPMIDSGLDASSRDSTTPFDGESVQDAALIRDRQPIRDMLIFDVSGVCIPGATEPQPCDFEGREGVRERRCSEDGIWGSWDLDCRADECEPGDFILEEGCNPAHELEGYSTTRVKSCGENHLWEDSDGTCYECGNNSLISQPITCGGGCGRRYLSCNNDTLVWTVGECLLDPQVNAECFRYEKEHLECSCPVFSVRECSDECKWGDFTPCPEPTCVEGQSGSAYDCETCGEPVTRNLICNAQCEWPEPNCTGVPVPTCRPGERGPDYACPSCSGDVIRHSTCTEACNWSEPDCSGIQAPDCTPGDLGAAYNCDSCGGPVTLDLICNNECQWPAQDCSGLPAPICREGEEGESYTCPSCGGEELRIPLICNARCQWPDEACPDLSEIGCVPGEEELISCGSDRFCNLGEARRTCNDDSCTWTEGDCLIPDNVCALNSDPYFCPCEANIENSIRKCSDACQRQECIYSCQEYRNFNVATVYCRDADTRCESGDPFEPASLTNEGLSNLYLKCNSGGGGHLILTPGIPTRCEPDNSGRCSSLTQGDDDCRWLECCTHPSNPRGNGYQAIVDLICDRPGKTLYIPPERLIEHARVYLVAYSENAEINPVEGCIVYGAGGPMPSAKRAPPSHP